MSAATARKPRKVEATKPAGETPLSHEEAARKIALLDAPGFLDVNRARAALWLLEQIDGDHLIFQDRDAMMSADDLEDWCRGIVKNAIDASLTAAEGKIRAAVKIDKPAKVA